MKPLFACCLLLLLAGCAGITPRPAMPLGQSSFAAYEEDARRWVANNRSYQVRDPGTEVALNRPREWRPQGRANKGILLIHGLGDSPFSFSDIGPALAEQGFLVRALLLPGHGTDPIDLDSVSYGDWRRLLEDQYAALRSEAGSVFVGGFSTGADLAVALAAEHEDIAGLLLFSPAFKTKWNNTWLAPLAAPFTTWARDPSPARPQQSPVRYMNIPVNGLALFHRSSRDARAALGKTYDKPAVLVLARHDSVLDVAFAARAFTERFSNPASRLIWYGEAPDAAAYPSFTRDARILQRPDNLPDERISRFSHMSVLFSPNNALYGRQGNLRICENGQPPEIYALCKAGNAELWFSDWGYLEPGKVHARLTFNPYFDWQMDVIGQALDGAAAPPPPLITPSGPEADQARSRENPPGCSAERIFPCEDQAAVAYFPAFSSR